VPLRGENRILARHGLQILRERRRPGVSALMEVAGILTEQPISPVDISYRLGPRINASGRLADAALSVELLLSEDREFSTEVALQLDTFNRERQEIERQMTEEAERMVADHFSRDPGIVLYRDNWHPGVVGIVAGRVSRTYHRPCIVLGDDGDLAKGSGRGIVGSNLVEILADCSGHLAGWGGHPMAVGVSLAKEGIDAFRQEFVAAIRRRSGNGFEEAPLDIAAWIRPEEIGAPLMDEIEALYPFGQGNPEPKFGIRAVQLARPAELFKGRHFRFQIDGGDGRRLYGVAWKMADRLPPFGEAIDLAVELKWNHFNGRKLLQLMLVDWRPTQ